MVFTKRLREGVRRGRIRCSVRIWKRLHIRFHYLAPGAWDVQPEKSTVGENRRTLLQRIRTSTSSALRRDRNKGL